MSNNEIVTEKTLEVWTDTKDKWVTYTMEEIHKYFHFVKEPKWENVIDIKFHDFDNRWLDINFKNGDNIVYKDIFGTYARQ